MSTQESNVGTSNAEDSHCNGSEKIYMETLVMEIDKTVQEVVDEVKNLENLQVGAQPAQNGKGPCILQTGQDTNIAQITEEVEQTVVVEPEKEIQTSNNGVQLEDNTVFTEVQQILMDVLNQVTEKSTVFEKMETSEEKDGCDVEDKAQSSVKPGSDEIMETSEEKDGCDVEDKAQSSVKPGSDEKLKTSEEKDGCDVEDKTQSSVKPGSDEKMDQTLEEKDGCDVEDKTQSSVKPGSDEKMKTSEEKDGCDVQDKTQSSVKPGSDERVETLDNKGTCEKDIDEQQHGTKRTHDEADLGGQPIESTKDSSYVMDLVQEEIDAVGKQLCIKENTKIVDYDSDSSESSDGESSESSSSESTSSDDSSIDTRIIVNKIENEEDKVHVEPPKTKDEILMNELPPEPLVELALPDDIKLMHIGFITSIVESIVVVRALPKTPAVDADTLLFLESRKCLGKVFETFGPVQSPFYSVRFNSPDDITKAEIKPDMLVFIAPEDLDFTKLVFTSEIEKFKGSDASWKHDQEPPVELIEYSDDEEESKAKTKKKQARKGNRAPIQGQTDGTPNGTQPAAPSNKQQQPREYPRTWQGRGRGWNTYGNNPRQPMIPPHPYPGGPYIPPGHLPPPTFQHPQRHYLPPHIPPPHPGQYLPPPPPFQPLRPPPLYPDMAYQPPPPPGMPPGHGAPPPWPPFNYRPPQ